MNDAGSSVVSILGWSLVLIVLLVALFGALMWLRRWIKEDDLGGGGAVGFGLSELRAMHRRGEISDEEFERARGRMTAGAKAITANMPDPAGGRRAPGAPPKEDPPQFPPTP